VADHALRLLYDPVARSVETYRWRDDALERVDLTSELPEDAERLRALADEYLERRPSEGVVREVELDELELGQLRALGYAIDDEPPPSPRDARGPMESP
jgi:hypothetical protein